MFKVNVSSVKLLAVIKYFFLSTSISYFEQHNSSRKIDRTIMRGMNRSADLALKSPRIVDFGDKSRGFADLKNTVDRGSAESFGPVSGFCQSRSLDCGSDHQFSVSLGQCAGVLFFLVTRRIYMYSRIDSVTKMTSGNLVHT